MTTHTARQGIYGFTTFIRKYLTEEECKPIRYPTKLMLNATFMDLDKFMETRFDELTMPDDLKEYLLFCYEIDKL